jgi:tetratricopeptide (TPR) repeat protein
MFCLSCGAQIPDHAKFCRHCGTSQDAPASTDGQQVQPAGPSATDLYLQGRSLWTEGRLEQAVAAYRQAITYQPDLPHAYYDLAQLMEVMQASPAETLLTYKHFVDLAKNDLQFGPQVQFAEDRVRAIKASGWDTQPAITPPPKIAEPQRVTPQTPVKQGGGIREVNRAIEEVNQQIKFMRNMSDLADQVDGLMADESPPVRQQSSAASQRPGGLTRAVGFVMRWITGFTAAAIALMALVLLFDSYYGLLWVFYGVFAVIGLVIAQKSHANAPKLSRYNWFMLLYLTIAFFLVTFFVGEYF